MNVLATGGGTSDRHIRIWNVCSGACLSAVDAHSQVRHEHQLGDKHLLAAPTQSCWLLRPRGMRKEGTCTSSLSYVCYCLFSGLFYPVVNKLQGVHFRPWLCTESACSVEVSNND